MTNATAEVPTGNTFDKYSSSNPVVKRLMGGFHATLDELWATAAAVMKTFSGSYRA